MDYHTAYMSKSTTPTEVAECIIAKVEEARHMNPARLFLVEFDWEDLRRQAAESTQRFGPTIFTNDHD